jgi:hypothetical protein
LPVLQTGVESVAAQSPSFVHADAARAALKGTANPSTAANPARNANRMARPPDC